MNKIHILHNRSGIKLRDSNAWDIGIYKFLRNIGFWNYRNWAFNGNRT